MAAQRIDNRRDIMLLLLYSPGVAEEFNEPIVGRTRLMKMLFLFLKEGMHHFQRGADISEERFYEFFPWNFGPFSSQVYDDLTFFTLHRFIEVKDTTEDTIPQSAAEWQMWLTSSSLLSTDEGCQTYREEAFSLTESGVKFARELYSLLSPAQRRFLRTFKRKLSGISLRAILQYVYDNYPEMTTRSKIKEELLGYRY